MKRTLLQPAYVLHRRLYRENSYLVELFTPEQGRLTVIARGVRKAKSSSSGLLQPFVPLLVSFVGKSELQTLTEVEANGMLSPLQGDCLFAGFYLNELLMCLLEKWDAHPRLYKAYEQTLLALSTDKLDERVLRSFEKTLLDELGYGLLPKTEPALRAMFSADVFYRFIPEHGFVVCETPAQRDAGVSAQGNVFSGKRLIAIGQEDWQDEGCVQDAKRLIRFVLAPLLGARPIHSRRLFMAI